MCSLTNWSIALFFYDSSDSCSSHIHLLLQAPYSMAWHLYSFFTTILPGSSLRLVRISNFTHMVNFENSHINSCMHHAPQSWNQKFYTRIDWITNKIKRIKKEHTNVCPVFWQLLPFAYSYKYIYQLILCSDICSVARMQFVLLYETISNDLRLSSSNAKRSGHVKESISET